MQVLSEEYQPFYSIIPQSEFITIKKPPIKGRRLPMKDILKTNTIITQKNKKTHAQNVSVHSGCMGIVIHIFIITQKKPQHNAEASTTTAMVSLLQCEGR
jgi:hypothetical protein